MKNLAYLLLAVAACVDSAATEDGIDDAFLVDGKEDVAGITEGSPEAVAVLRVANEKNQTELKDHGVPRLAAKNIVTHRANGPFTTLARLDAVPYVGPNAFARLLAYATELGYVASTPTPDYVPADLWHTANCPQITYAQLLAKFPAGETIANLGRTFTKVRRTRNTCNPVTGCTAWWVAAPESAGEIYISNAYDLSQIRVDFQGPGFTLECNSIVETNDFVPECRNTNGVFPDGQYGQLDGHLCADGSFHFVSKLADNESDDAFNLNQIAVYGRLF